jgi:hypothetical protein
MVVSKGTESGRQEGPCASSSGGGTKARGGKSSPDRNKEEKGGEWGPDHGARLKGEGVLVEWWIGGPGSQHRPRTAGDGRRTAGVCATRDRGGEGRGASTRGPLWAR